MPEEQKNKPLWAQQIASLRAKLGISQAAMASLLSTSQSNVSSWESGRYRPSPSQFIELAKLSPVAIESVALMHEAGVSADFFAGKSPKGMVPAVVAESAVKDAERRRMAELAASGALNSMDDAIRHIPLLRDAAAAGTPREVDEDDIERLIGLPRDWLPRGGTLYLLRVKGDSMEPILLDGHLVIVNVDNRTPKELVNRMVVAGGDGVTIKWLREDEGDYLLVPHHVSVRHPVRVLKPHNKLRILGEVVRWIGAPPDAPRRR